MRRKLREERGNVSLNLDASLETARAGLELLRNKKVLDVDKTADALENLINSTAKQNERLIKAITR